MKLQYCTFPLFFFLFFFASGNGSHAQCPFDPTIEGNAILCPGDSTVLKTQVYDAYQWYRRPYGASQAEPIPGATGQSIKLTEMDVLNYYSVEVTQNGCTETSPEVLLDSWVFVLPTISHSGDYYFDPVDLTFHICQGDTMFLTLNPPYEANIVWYKNGEPIPGETFVTYAVTEEGSYTVVGAPLICPNFILSPGVEIQVEVEVCNSVGEPHLLPEVEMYPNPVSDVLYLDFSFPSPSATWKLTDVYGRQLESTVLPEGSKFQIDLSHFPAGVYWLHLYFAEGEKLVRKVVKH